MRSKIAGGRGGDLYSIILTSSTQYLVLCLREMRYDALGSGFYSRKMVHLVGFKLVRCMCLCASRRVIERQILPMNRCFPARED